MKYEWLEQYLLSKQAAIKEFKQEWNATRFLLNEKMFCMIGEDKSNKSIVTLKCDPLLGQALRQEHNDIIAGYYMNKDHWNSVYLEGNVPDEVLRHMVDMSYELIFNSLTKKVQNDILSR